MLTIHTEDIRATLWPSRMLQVRRALTRSDRIVVGLGLVALAVNAWWVQYECELLGGLSDASGPTFWLHPAIINSVVLALLIFYSARQISRTRHKLAPLAYPLLERIEVHRGREVWRSVEPLTKRTVNLHVVFPDRFPLAGSTWKDVSHRWIKRGEKARRLSSPHSAKLVDCGFAEGERFYAAMELPRGITLHDMVRLYGPCEPDRCLFLLAQVAHAIQDAHAYELKNLSLRPQHVWIGCRSSNADWVTVELFGYEEPGDETAGAHHDLYQFACMAAGMLSGKWLDPKETTTSDATQPVLLLDKLPIPYTVRQTLTRCLTAAADDALPPLDELIQRMWASLPGPMWNNDRAQSWWSDHPSPP